MSADPQLPPKNRSVVEEGMTVFRLEPIILLWAEAEQQIIRPELVFLHLACSHICLRCLRRAEAVCNVVESATKAAPAFERLGLRLCHQRSATLRPTE